MIKTIKIGDLVYQGIEAKTIDENGKEIWNIPSDLEKLRACTIDTLNWLIGQEVKNSVGDYTKLSAANSKALVLLVKAVDGVADKSNFTQTEQDIWNEMLKLANAGYGDSNLLLNSLKAVSENITKYSTMIDSALKATTVEELIKILEGL
jgi:adenine-specific DNA methylase